MARINLDDSIFKEQGYQDLLIVAGNRHLAMGYVVGLYQLAQKYWFPERKPIPHDVFEASGLPECLYAKGGLARFSEEGIYARGAEDQFAWLFQKSEAGKKPKKKRIPKKKKDETGDNARSSGDNGRSSEPNGSERDGTSSLFSLSSSLFSLSSSLSSLSSDLTSHNSELSSRNLSDEVVEQPSSAADVVPLKSTRDANKRVWESYRGAYFTRYKVEPVRNAKINGAIANFVKRVGESEAPDIAAFFVNHNDSFYLKSMHSFGLCLRDAEALRTQWLKGRTITTRDIKKIEQRLEQDDLLAAIERGEV